MTFYLISIHVSINKFYFFLCLLSFVPLGTVEAPRSLHSSFCSCHFRGPVSNACPVAFSCLPRSYKALSSKTSFLPSLIQKKNDSSWKVKTDPPPSFKKVDFVWRQYLPNKTKAKFCTFWGVWEKLQRRGMGGSLNHGEYVHVNFERLICEQSNC